MSTRLELMLMVRPFSPWCLLLGGCLWGGLMASPTAAEVVPDGTLPDASRVAIQDNIRVISGGTRRGGNLFHSFEAFSVPSGGTASFRGVSSDIAHLLARVTGASISRIDGAIEVLQPNGSVSPADVFLLNPNGIIFGADASLNVGGSFIATTAERIDFADGTRFSAVNPEADPLLTVSVPIGLQFGRTPGSIVNLSIAPLLDGDGNVVVGDQGNPFFGGLQVPAGQTLGLLGGDVVLPGGVLTVASGRIEVGSVASADAVELNPRRGWRVNYDGVRTFGNIELSDFAVVNASGEGGGAVQLRGDRILIRGESLVLADTFGSQNGQGIAIRASQLTLEEFSLIGSGTFGPGAGGTVQIWTDQLLLREGSQIDVGSEGGGPGGRVQITSTQTIDLIGGRSDGDSFFSSGLFARTEGAFAGGNISLTTDRLSLRDGGQIVASSRGTGDAGTITIDANRLTIAGVGQIAAGVPFIREDLGGLPGAPSGLITAGASGDGNTITITAQQVRLRDGAVIQSATQGAGNAGDIRIRATEAIALSGVEPVSQAPTGLLAFSGGIPGLRDFGNPAATGRGGNLRIFTPELTVRDGAVMATGSLNPSGDAAGAGNIRFRGETLRLDQRGLLVAATASGDGGDITLNAQEQLLLRNRSEISTTAGSANAGGDGGNIAIRAGFVIAVPSENSDITANAFTGNGGNVNIVTQSLLGIVPRDRLTPASDITATSERGLVGNITITSPDTDSRLGLAELPSAPVTTELAQGCQATGEQATAAFFNYGRGGVPPTGDEPLSSGNILDDVRLPVAAAAPPVEAQGWRVDEQGAIALVADLPRPVAVRCHLR
ncbi:MAG: filamentous hemagglutinin N-terminal domain-containing protein [Synechococcales bacterium]|nr:filamentous hemagglutinin N-terminal domain-containing protein [Synechococcales bacterium]